MRWRIIPERKPPAERRWEAPQVGERFYAADPNRWEFIPRPLVGTGDVNLEIVEALSDRERLLGARRATEVLQAGGLVVHPTETVYGIGGDGSPQSNALLARVKRRDAERPLIVLVPDLETLGEWLPGIHWPAEARALAEVFWPGALTLVLPCSEAPSGVRGPDGGVAVRVSPDPMVRAIMTVWERPMTSTSANLSGSPPARDAEQAARLVTKRADLTDLSVPVIVLDAGPREGKEPSTVVGFQGAFPQFIREGPVTRAQITRVVPHIM